MTSLTWPLPDPRISYSRKSPLIVVPDLRGFQVPELRRFQVPELRRFQVPKLRKF
jgi:hypothetical protein